DAVAPRERESRLAMIDKDHPDLAPVVGVDGAGAVEQADTMLEGQAGAWADLRLIAGGKSDGEAGRDEPACARREFTGFGSGRQQVDARRRLARIGGQGQVPSMRQAAEWNLKGRHRAAITTRRRAGAR